MFVFVQKLSVAAFFFILVMFGPSAFAGTQVFIAPTTSAISNGCNYGNTPCASETGAYHSGIDFRGSGDKTVRATNHGRVHAIVKNGQGDHGLGNTVILEHFLANGGRVCSSYSHLASIDPGIYEKLKARGDEKEWLTAGTIIGVMGGTGYGQSQHWVTHLHFEIKLDCTLDAPDPRNRYWGYTVDNPSNHGYVDPNDYIGKKYAEHPYLEDGSTTLLYKAYMSEGYPYGMGGGGVGSFNLKLDFDIMDPATGVEWIAGQKKLVPGQIVNLKVQVKAENGNTSAYMQLGKDSIEVDYYVWTSSGEWSFLQRQYIKAANLPSGGTHTETVQYTVPQGVSQVSFKVKIDAEDEAHEKNEGDNWSRIETFTVRDPMRVLLPVLQTILND